MVDFLRDWDEAMGDAVAESIENLAFIEVIPAREKKESDDDVLSGTVQVETPFGGELQLVMPKELVFQMSETVYGPILEDITDSNLESLLIELLNTIAEKFLSDILPESQTIHLGEPEVEEGVFCKPEDPSLVWNFSAEDLEFTICVSGESLLSLTDIEDTG